MDYSLIMLEELQKLENLSEDYKGELKFLSKKIRKDFWNTDYNTEKLAKLATYLKEQGVTGIIYPCTRTNKVVGKNLVLFNKNDAEPIESTIREFNY